MSRIMVYVFYYNEENWPFPIAVRVRKGDIPNLVSIFNLLDLPGVRAPALKLDIEYKVVNHSLVDLRTKENRQKFIEQVLAGPGLNPDERGRDGKIYCRS